MMHALRRQLLTELHTALMLPSHRMAEPDSNVHPEASGAKQSAIGGSDKSMPVSAPCIHPVKPHSNAACELQTP